MILDDYKENFTMLDLRTRSDGRGGVIYTYVDGAEFKAAISMKDSLGVQIAQKQSVTSEYLLSYDRPVKLSFHNIIRREKDGKTYRVMNQDEKRPPTTAMYPNMRSVIIEVYEIPSEVEDD